MLLLNRLEQAFKELNDALDGQDPEHIIAAAAAIRPLVSEIEETGVWTEDPAMKKRLVALMRLIDAARFRVNKLTNLNERRAINLALALGAGTSPTYDKLL
ncbi:hypothetical protein GCM10009096_07830 [Parasphingorhabdus litoris]|uniref:Flagellar protein FliT n=1 Tax=Parasphingorhabdus litoris TaxID=394733 RepID=A0ABN1A790_9SPHN|nr:hypothetical protein [Parasphingorhabdus litoris]